MLRRFGLKGERVKRNRFWGIGLIIVAVLVVGMAGCTVGGATLKELPSSLAINLGSQQTGIWVSGQGELNVVPDIANLSLGISAQAKTVAQAQAAAATAMNNAMNALSQGGVARKDIQTQHFSIQQITRWDKDREQESVIGYRVTNMVLAKIRDINQAGSIIDAVATAGGDLTRINSISFAVDDPSKYYSEVRQKAMADANAKARQLADLGGVKLGKPTYVSESTVYPVPRPVYEAKVAAAPAPPTPISPGEMKITLNVQVVYAIEK